MPAPSFVAALGEVFEHAPWVAEAAAEGRPYPTVEALHGAMMQAVRAAPPERQQAFIGGHPELGSRVNRADLTDASQAEQGRLGLDRLSAEEFDRFSASTPPTGRNSAFPSSFASAATPGIRSCAQFERRLQRSRSRTGRGARTRSA